MQRADGAADQTRGGRSIWFIRNVFDVAELSRHAVL